MSEKCLHCGDTLHEDVTPCSECNTNIHTPCLSSEGLCPYCEEQAYYEEL